MLFCLFVLFRRASVRAALHFCLRGGCLPTDRSMRPSHKVQTNTATDTRGWRRSQAAAHKHRVQATGEVRQRDTARCKRVEWCRRLQACVKTRGEGGSTVASSARLACPHLGHPHRSRPRSAPPALWPPTNGVSGMSARRWSFFCLLGKVRERCVRRLRLVRCLPGPCPSSGNMEGVGENAFGWERDEGTDTAAPLSGSACMARQPCRSYPWRAGGRFGGAPRLVWVGTVEPVTQSGPSPHSFPVRDITLATLQNGVP